MVPKSGSPVLGQIALYSGSVMVMAVFGNWLAQVSIRGNFASSPDDAQFAYALAILERHDLVADQASGGLDSGDLADFLADQRGAQRRGDGDRVHAGAHFSLAHEHNSVRPPALHVLDFHA